MNNAKYDIRNFLEKQQMAREHFTHVHKPVHHFTIMQYLTRSAISNCFSSKLIGKSRQKLSQISVT
jgi:hypothetical protein